MSTEREMAEKLRADIPQHIWDGANLAFHDRPWPVEPEDEPAVERIARFAMALLETVAAERDALRELACVPYLGRHFTIEHDGFSGPVIGAYTTLEGKRGVVMQLDGKRVVHVYGMKWIAP